MLNPDGECSLYYYLKFSVCLKMFIEEMVGERPMCGPNKKWFRSAYFGSRALSLLSRLFHTISQITNRSSEGLVIYSRSYSHLRSRQDLNPHLNPHLSESTHICFSFSLFRCLSLFSPISFPRVVGAGESYVHLLHVPGFAYITQILTTT